MEEILKECARQVPALVILVILAYVFAKSGAVVVKAFLAQMSESRAEYLRAIDRFHADNLEARSASRLTVAENTIASDKQSAAINALTLEVRELRQTLQPVIRKLHQLGPDDVK